MTATDHTAGTWDALRRQIAMPEGRPRVVLLAYDVTDDHDWSALEERVVTDGDRLLRRWEPVTVLLVLRTSMEHQRDAVWAASSWVLTLATMSTTERGRDVTAISLVCDVHADVAQVATRIDEVQARPLRTGNGTVLLGTTIAHHSIRTALHEATL